MYTTLAILKTAKACVPGYSRMISFFGNGKDVRDQKIPLHAVSLVGGATDAEWALANGVILDKEQYDDFYRRNMPAVFKSLIHQYIYLRRHRSNHMNNKNSLVKDLIEECYKCHTFEECEAMLNKLRGYNFSHDLFTEVLYHSCWSAPYQFISYCFELVESTYDVDSGAAFPEDVKARDAANKPATRRRAASRFNDNDEGDDNDEYREDDDMDAREEAPRNTRRTDLENPYWIRTTSPFRTKGQNIAHMLHPDPYEFMSRLKYKMPKGVTVKPNAGGELVLTTEVKDTKSMFTILRTITAKSELADQDTDD